MQNEKYFLDNNKFTTINLLLNIYSEILTIMIYK